jgi:6-phosphogluconolactonase (cycloisomerase 2 family)
MASMLVPGAAFAVEGGTLTQLPFPDECVGNELEQVAICGTNVTSGMNAAYELQVSPDGTSAYSVAVGNGPGEPGSLVEYSRDPVTGALSVIGCVTAAETPTCSGEHATTDVSSLGNPAAISISGEDVYVIGQGEDTIVEFQRDPATGLLTKFGCISNETPSGECATSAPTLTTPYDIAVSPDGKSAYVTSLDDESVVELERDPGTGELTAIAGHECIGSLDGCPDGAGGLVNAIGVVVSPNGKNVYVAARAKGESGDVAVFERNLSTGVLTQLPGNEGCVGEGVEGCDHGVALKSTEALAITPNGKNVYATSFDDDAIAELKVGTGGKLELPGGSNDCVTSETIAGCKTVPGLLGSPLGVAVSPDGANLYASSSGDSAVAEFQIEASGVLKPLEENAGCVTSGSSGCEPGGDELVGLEGARRITVSPDNVNVYVAGQGGNDIVELARHIKPAIAEVSPHPVSEAGGTAVTITGSGFGEGDEVMFGATPAATVTVNSSSSITAVTPVGAGPQVVTVINAVGESENVPASRVTYEAPIQPTVTEVSPSTGAEPADTTVTITGSEFIEPATVRFGSAAAVSEKVNLGDSITATAPTGTGTVDVTVQTSKGTSAVTAADRFEYQPGGLGQLAGYCSGLGDVGNGTGSTAFLLGAIEGPGFAYDNWACVTSSGALVRIANLGADPSMAKACAAEYPLVTSYAYPGDVNNAFSWGCHLNRDPALEAERFVPAKAEPNTPSTGTTAKIAAVGPSVPPPVLAKTGNVAPVSGKVLVRVPGSNRFVALETLTSIPFGSVIDATQGRVVVTTAGPHGTVQVGEFFEGKFVLRQGHDGLVVAELSGGDFSVCPTAKERAHRASAHASAKKAAGKHVVRKLWADAHGSYSTKGNYAAGAVQGTEWLTEDLCEGTFIKVTRDKVKVTNLVRHKSVMVKVGHSYLARAPGR